MQPTFLSAARHPLLSALLGAAFAFACASAAGAQPEPAAPVATAADVAPAGELLSGPELDDLVARIALYPDELLALIFPASTEPFGDRPGGALPRCAREGSEPPAARGLGPAARRTAQLSRHHQDDERRPRLDGAARRRGDEPAGRRDGCRAAGAREGAGRGQPPVERAAGGDAEGERDRRPVGEPGGHLRPPVQPRGDLRARAGARRLLLSAAALLLVRAPRRSAPASSPAR